MVTSAFFRMIVASLVVLAQQPTHDSSFFGTGIIVSSSVSQPLIVFQRLLFPRPTLAPVTEKDAELLHHSFAFYLSKNIFISVDCSISPLSFESL